MILVWGRVADLAFFLMQIVGNLLVNLVHLRLTILGGLWSIPSAPLLCISDLPTADALVKSGEEEPFTLTESPVI